MNFLFPTFLFGLLAVGIPIIIHLFNFQRPKTIFFTNVRFLKNVKEVTTSRLKLKHLLVLLCRILFICFLVLTFTQPFIAGNNAIQMQSKPHVLAYIDNSYSMQAGNNGENLLDLGIRDFRKLAALYPLNTQFQVTTNDFEGRDQFLINKNKLSERIADVPFTYVYQDLQSVAKRIASSSSINFATNHLFFFSDFQKSTLGDLSALKLDSNQQYFLVPLQAKEKSNVFIDSVWLGSPIVRANETNTVEVILQNTAGGENKKVLVKLYIDNIQNSATEVEIASGGSEKVSISFVCDSIGQKRCKLVFEDYPVVFDNNYFFVINVSPKVKILNLYQERDGFVKKVYGNTQLFDLQSSSINDLDYSQIEASSLVVLEGLTTIPASLASSLQAFVRKGGSVAIYPSAKLDITAYAALFSKLATPLPTIISSDTTANSKANYTLQTPNYQQPFFKNVFEKEDKKIDMPYAFATLDLQKKGEKILQSNNGDFYLSQFRNLDGKIYLFASPLETSYTNFPKHAMFVPVMYKIAFESINTATRLAYSLQDAYANVTLPPDVLSERSLFSLQKDSFNIIPAQQIQGRSLSFSIPNIEVTPGIYSLKQNNKTVSYVAINQSKNESINATYSLEELNDMAKKHKNVQVYKADVNESFLEQFKAENIGIPLWKYCLMAAFFFLVAEVLLLRFYK